MSVSVSVRTSVRKIIDFCRKDLRGARVLLSTETLTLWFSRFQNRIARNKVKEWYRPVQGPLFGPTFATFVEMFTKWWTLIDPPIPVGYGAFWMLSSIWRNLTCDHCCLEHLVQSAHGWRECYAPLPCTVYLVWNDSSEKDENNVLHLLNNVFVWLWYAVMSC